MLTQSAIDSAREGFLRFIASTRVGKVDYRLTPLAEPTPYARCFALFGLHLLRSPEAKSNKPLMIEAIHRDLNQLRDERRSVGVDLSTDKPYLQLLAFSLSALAILDDLKANPLDEHVTPLLSADVRTDLKRIGALRGQPRSGNTAMFIAILLLHARDYLDLDVQDRISDWCTMHLEATNTQGFWGSGSSMSHLQFQNGYHQYEILEYLECPDTPWDRAANSVASLADADGHFAPYPGGGGCFDYDAVFILTGASAQSIERNQGLLRKTALSLLNEQNADGGFAESLRIRPRTATNIYGLFSHAFNASGLARRERFRQALTLLRPAHDRMKTHWSRYSRRWEESDLWDSWFRMLTLARIQVTLDPSSAGSWGFINYPGIGFHHSVRQ